MMADYHKYVFNKVKRKFVGKFEEMYKHENQEGFDSWHQENNNQLDRKILLEIYNQYNFTSVLDIGCGKSSFTHLLKRNNNFVTGVDVSKTAIKESKERFPSIDFLVHDFSSIKSINSFFITKSLYDLTLISETLSYIKNWKHLLKTVAEYSEYFLIKLYIPENPIGFVKSERDLLRYFIPYFDLIQHINIKNELKVILFGKSKIK